MEDEAVLLHAFLMKMPVFAHADYMKTIQKMLNTDHYPKAYLQQLEDLVVKQTQLLLGLPLDK
jgi:hypothetical protein